MVVAEQVGGIMGNAVDIIAGNAPEVRQAIVEVDAFLLGQFFTRGWRGKGIECTDGLPPTAKFVRMFPSRYGSMVSLVFEDESFVPVPISGNIPTLSVVFKKTFDEPEKFTE